MFRLAAIIGRFLTLTPSSLPPAGAGTAASYTLTPIGSAPPFSTRLRSVDAPVGWVLAGAAPGPYTLTDLGAGVWTITINIDGSVDIDTPDAASAGEFSLNFGLRDAEDSAVAVTRTVRVVALPFEVSGGPLAAVTVGTPYSDTLTLTGGIAPYLAPSENLPAGLSVSILGGTATVSGTATGAGLGAGTNFSIPIFIDFEDSGTGTFQYLQTLSVTVPAMSMPGSYTNTGNVGAAYSSTVAATGGVGAPYTYAIASGSLTGSGLTLNTSTGEISGTLGSAAVYNFTTSATDANGNTVTSGAQTITITAAIVRWNPADTSAEMLLSSGNAVATRSANSGGSWFSTRSVTSHNSGKKYARIKYISGSGNGTMIGGVGTSAASLSSFPGVGATSYGCHCDWTVTVQTLFNSGAIAYGGNQMLAPGESMFVAIDFAAGKMWLGTENSLNTAVTWCGNGDPSTGSTPTYTFTPGTTFFLMLGCSNPGQIMQLYNQPGEGLYTLPTGFSMWE